MQFAEAALNSGAATLAAVQLPELAAAAGAAATPAALPASCRVAEVGPLLAAAGAEARRALKMEQQPGQPTRRPEAAAAASSLQSADAEIRCEAIEEPGRKRRCVVPEAVVSPFF